MKKILFLVLLVACSTPLTFAQSTSDDDFPNAEFFIGFSHNRIDTQVDEFDEDENPFDDREGLNGFDTQVTANINRYFGVKGDISGHYKSDTFDFDGSQFKAKTQLYNFLAGPEVKARNSSRVTPFAHALFGVGHTRVRFSADDFDDTTESETDFAMAFGGGIDVSVNDKISLRVIQADYNPTFFGDTRQDNIRLSFGVIFK